MLISTADGIKKRPRSRRAQEVIGAEAEPTALSFVPRKCVSLLMVGHRHHRCFDVVFKTLRSGPPARRCFARNCLPATGSQKSDWRPSLHSTRSGKRRPPDADQRVLLATARDIQTRSHKGRRARKERPRSDRRIQTVGGEGTYVVDQFPAWL
jgi:hypothetical protein